VALALIAVMVSQRSASAQIRPPSIERTRESWSTGLARGEYVDRQDDQWEWKLIDLNGCNLAIRQTIHSPEGPLVTEFAVDLRDLGRMNFADGWVAIATREPTIMSRTYLRIGEPSEERIESFVVKFPDRGMAQTAVREIMSISTLCRMQPPRK
jgi:hypothetical protein